MEPIHFDHRFTTKRGFTLVELLVVFAIIVTISGVVLSSQSNFNKTLVLANTSYDIALSLRASQTFGLGSRASDSSANAGYGMHFDMVAPQTLVLFADTSPASSCSRPDCKPGDYVYELGMDMVKQTYALGNGIRIADFCGYSNGWSCARTGAFTALDIVFERPNPTAHVTSSGYVYTAACITVASPQGGSRFISITASGQIAANVPSDPASCHEL